MIDQQLYDLAWSEMKTLKSLISAGEFELVKLSSKHKDALTEFLL